MTDNTIGSNIAEGLLGIGAVAISNQKPFTWASGLKSPIYCDNRLTLGYPILRNLIASSFAEIIGFKQIECDIVAGTATAGIPHASILATHMELPMCYVRSSAKGHGRKNKIEGPPVKGQKVVVIEDLVSTGMSSLNAVNAIREAGGEVTAVLAIFSYGFPFAAEAFSKENVDVFVLTDYDRLLEVAVRVGAIPESELEQLRLWRKDPETWGMLNT